MSASIGPRYLDWQSPKRQAKVDVTPVGLRIALTGAKGSGKSTLAEYMTSRHGFTELSFADPLKDLVADLFMFDREYCYDPAKKEQVIAGLGVSARSLLQTVGTELFRDRLRECLPNLKLRGGSVWIHRLAAKLEELPASTSVVVSDCRFEDEYDALIEAGFVVIRISRMTDTTGTFSVTSQHASEQGCRFDCELYNTSTKEALFAAFDAHIAQHTKKHKGD